MNAAVCGSVRILIQESDQCVSNIADTTVRFTVCELLYSVNR